MARASLPFLVTIGVALAACGKERAPFVGGDGPVPHTAGSRNQDTSHPEAGGGGLAEVAAGAAGEGPIATSGGDDSGGSGGSAPTGSGALTRVVKGGPWALGQQTTGFVVDHQGRLYLNDERHVFVIEGSDVSEYMTVEDVALITGDNANQISFTDLDLGEDDALYLGVRGKVIKSTSAHSGTVWGDFGAAFSPYPADFEEKLAVLSDDALVITESQGLYLIEHDKASLIYEDPPEGQSWATDCASHDFTAARNGTFLFLPGCNGSSLIQGNADGSGSSVLYEADPKGPLQAANFHCVTRRPGGGFYFVSQTFNTSSDADGPHLYYLSETNGQPSSVVAVPSTPSLRAVWRDLAGKNEPFVFDYCSLAAAEDGTIYLQSMSQVWRIAP
ncbi:MAG TPA: hypothetical protein VHP33_30940 [Polyangiaceae bacterium]|nr:hypothetical protein [Polyangiaceae bacterium]